MGTVTTADGVEIFYKDWGSGQPIVFSHGWPLSADDWDTQMMFFLLRGYRVIAHDRRGHGRSTQVNGGALRRLRTAVREAHAELDAEDVPRIPARHADHRGRDDQR
jgi:non-heme chloroperoxidase